MAAASEHSIRTLSRAAAWLEGLIDRERRRDWSYPRLSLAPVEALLAAVGHPERGPSVIHIAGSKGKGSTALFCETILREAGMRVGTFTSPHLRSWTERFRVDGQDVSEERLVRAVERVRAPVDALRAGSGPVPSFFDATTAVAWLVFADAQVDYAVVEVGLGGRLDSTNAVQPAVTCVTSIELEHTELLGETQAAIAAEKAGILKPGVPAVVGGLKKEALCVVEARARELDAPVSLLGREIELEVEADDLRGSRFRVRDAALEVRARTPLLGAHPPHNAALAVACVRRVLGAALSPDALAGAAQRGIERTRLPGRLEVLAREPWILVDAAHTPASVEALTEVLDRLGGRARLVVSISSDKDVEGLLSLLLPRASRLTLTRAEATRSLDPAQIAVMVRKRSSSLPVSVVPDPQQALSAAAEGLRAGDVLCATGSVYLAGIARAVLGELPGSLRVARSQRSGNPVAHG